MCAGTWQCAEHIFNSVVDCEAGGGACRFGLFEESIVRSSRFSTACENNVVLDRSTVQCLEAGTCERATFYSSSVKCALGACVDAEFAARSCCDGTGPDALSMAAFRHVDPIQLRYRVFVRVCTWNQVARLEAIPAATMSRSKFCLRYLLGQSFYSLGEDTNVCRRNECAGTSVTNCTMLCFDTCRKFGSTSSNFVDSVVDCEAGGACNF
jgi:hypothetical protein